jgi:hypothetical protein
MSPENNAESAAKQQTPEQLAASAAKHIQFALNEAVQMSDPSSDRTYCNPLILQLLDTGIDEQGLNRDGQKRFLAALEADPSIQKNLPAIELEALLAHMDKSPCQTTIDLRGLDGISASENVGVSGKAQASDSRFTDWVMQQAGKQLGAQAVNNPQHTVTRDEVAKLVNEERTIKTTQQEIERASEISFLQSKFAPQLEVGPGVSLADIYDYKPANNEREMVRLIETDFDSLRRYQMSDGPVYGGIFGTYRTNSANITRNDLAVALYKIAEDQRDMARTQQAFNKHFSTLSDK